MPTLMRALSPEESRRVLADKAELADPEASSPRVLEVVVRDETELREVELLLATAMVALRTQRMRVRTVLDAMLPAIGDTLGRGAASQARRNAELQAAIEGEFGLLTAAEIAERAGSTARNASATAGRWRQSGRVFAVVARNRPVYPGFQFGEDGQPLPAVAEVLRLLTGHLEGWELAAWFTTPRPELDGRRPADVLDQRTDDLAELAGWTVDAMAADAV